MKTLLFSAVLTGVCILPALSQDGFVSSEDASAFLVERGRIIYSASPDHLDWSHLPHYYGRGEWHGSRTGCPAPDGSVWGVGPRPRSYHDHIWDDYCYETTKCPHCGFCLGGVIHTLRGDCKASRGTQGCGDCAGQCESQGLTVVDDRLLAPDGDAMAQEGPMVDEDPMVPSGMSDPSKADSEKESKDAKKKSSKEKSPQTTSTDFYEDADVIPSPTAVFTREQNGNSDASRAENALWHQGKTTTRWRWQRGNRVKFRSAR